MKVFSRFTLIRHGLLYVAFGVICLFPAHEKWLPILKWINKEMEKVEG